MASAFLSFLSNSYLIAIPSTLLPAFGSFEDLQDGCLTRRPQHPTSSLCQPLVGTAMPADQNFWFRQDRIFLQPRSGFFATLLGVACKDDIRASRWEFLLRNCKQANRVKSSSKKLWVLFLLRTGKKMSNLAIIITQRVVEQWQMTRPKKMMWKSQRTKWFGF